VSEFVRSIAPAGALGVWPLKEKAPGMIKKVAVPTSAHNNGKQNAKVYATTVIR